MDCVPDASGNGWGEVRAGHPQGSHQSPRQRALLDVYDQMKTASEEGLTQLTMYIEHGRPADIEAAVLDSTHTLRSRLQRWLQEISG